MKLFSRNFVENKKFNGDTWEFFFYCYDSFREKKMNASFVAFIEHIHTYIFHQRQA